MQKGVPNNALDQQHQSHGGQSSVTTVPDTTVQHYVLANPLTSLATQPGSALSTLNIQGSQRPTSQIVTSTNPLQQQAVVVASEDLGRLLNSVQSQGSTPVLRQLSGQGILSVVGPRGQPVSFHGGTLVTDQTGELQICQQPLTALVTTTSTSATSAISISGGTVHHLGQSPSRGGSIPHTNLQPKLLTMSAQQSGQQQQSQTPQRNVAAAGSSSSAIAAAGRVLMEAKPSSGLSLTFPNLTALANQSSMTGPSPKKKVKVEEKTAVSQEVSNNRKLVLDLKYKDMQEVKENYIDCLTEMFFLQNGGNMMDFFTWKKRPTPQLVHFLKSGNLDSDEEEDHGQERKINNEVKVITCSGSNVPIATPVAISTTLPPSVAALNQQGCDPRRPGGRHGMVFGHVQPLAQNVTPVQSAIVMPGSVSVLSGTSSTVITTTSSAAQLTSTTTVATPSITSTAVSMPQLQSQLTRVISESKPLTVQTNLTPKSTILSPSTSQSIKSSKSPPLSPSRLHTRQHTISAVYDDSLGVGTQEAIVERAKQEAQVMQRVAELRKEGLWSTRRLPKVQEPPRNKGHWDYLLEEMQWLAADFAQERKWKKAAARKLAKMVSKYFQELEQKEIKAEKEEAQKLKKIAGQIAKQVREFWTNIEKVVQYKQQARMDEKRKKALDLHLNFIVDQTEKYSTWLTEGLQKGSRAGSSVSGSVLVTPDNSSDGGDDEFEPEDHESDDEETIEKEEEEAGIDEVSTKEEIDALQKESELPIEELLKTLPPEVLDKPASLSGDQEADDEAEDKDKEFKVEEDAADEEDTIAEQEKHEKKIDYSKELKDLQDENDLSVEDLYKKYAEAYASDYEMSEEEDETDSEDESEEEESDDEEEEEDEEDQEMKEEKDVGLEYLMDQEKEDPDKSQGDFESKGPGKEITDIAAEAQSLQPKGYTLETTTVKTSVPFLLKHTLREYQHVGLDWLATMYEKRLNGILADEMGLGKTIQTIALLAHLACEKGIWGPHLIVVPTSVMLNWEMEIKKWCPAFKILTYYGTQKERKMKRQGWTKTNAFHICITSYKLVIQDHQSFRRKKWKYFILDEAQNIKNFKSQRWQTLLNFSSQRRLLLTGTPLQNSLMELWSLMHFLMPHVFQSHREFKEWFANPLTGMIEGSHEYNESLIKRLHKVLRPFLLRRLKKDVEKQMPKKYEHVVMCHLSKRQRYLYDDFMSQTKTKETLATGHFMSVINILMQLRKVCNHPSLFDPRPIISPFKMRGITHHIPSLVLNCLNYDPFQDVDIHSLYPTLADMEKDLPAFIAHRVKRLQTTRKMIEEIDDRPDPPPRLAPGKLKPVSIKNLPSVEQPGRLSPATGQLRAASPMISSSSVPVGIPSAPTVNQTSVNSSTVVTSATQTLQATTLQAKILPQSAGQNVVLSSAGHQVSTSQPITVQIHQTEQGARLMIPAGQLSQLPAGFIQIVQTSMGQQIIASTPHTSTSGIVASNMTSTAVSSPATASTISVVNGPPTITTAASTLVSTSVTAVNTQVKYSVQLPSTSTITAVQKPVMKVSPMASSPTPVVSVTGGEKVSKPDITTTTSTTSSRMSVCSERQKEMELKKKSPLFHKMLHEKKQQQRKDSLGYIAKMNKKHCEIKPVYGQDLCQAVNVFRDMEKTHVKDNTWSGIGMAYCHNVHNTKHPKDPGYYWKQTKVLSELIHSPEQYLKEMEEILNRYVFVTPSVMAPQIQMHASHPAPSYLTEQRCREFMFQKELSPKTSCLHRISTCMTVQFPELRLIQYDCGKLQTLDILLRQLKSGGHRVLIFTQMTKMLNILEAFLNFHGHRYLRLDGTTKVEQRQFLMERFNADKRIFCFILSTRSGGIGVNLTGADTVIFYDSDWNPTMDAQAQDRCHRIGQTRDVHIYRLISERTIEENILKKANQKRMLGDMAIEGGNFTTAFFREQTIKELFSEPSGLQSLAKEKEEMERIKEEVDKDSMSKGDMKAEPEAPSDKIAVAQFEKVLAKAEDETDAQAVDLVKAEQKAELAEFDENIPWDEREAEQKKEDELSRAEQEIAMLDKELTPVERYAVGFMEMELEPLTEELDMAEEDIEQAKKDWELSRLKALKEEEERRAELEEDEMLYIYSRDDAYNQVFISDLDQEKMPMWSPPTPPHDDNDRYIDQTMFFLYEPNIMPETQLPPVYIKKEHKKPKIESITTRKQKQRKEEQTRVPRSLFDRPSAQLLKMRREHKLKSGLLKPFRPVPPIVKQPTMDHSADHPEWLIHEDWALLQAVQSLFDVPLNLMVVSPAHHPNWDLVADVVNTCSRVYRSAKQCKLRYEGVIIPREEGRILYDINPKKQNKKTKGIYKGRNLPHQQTKNNRPMRTSQLYLQDNNQAVTMLYSLRFDSTKAIAGKRPPPMKQTLVNPTLKNPKHATVLSENNINYDQPLQPMAVAEIRAQRIQREKKQSQAAAQATAEQQLATQRTQVQQATTVQQLTSAQQTQQTTVTTVTASAGQTVTQVAQTQLQPIQTAVSSAVLTGVVQKTAVGQAVSTVSIPRTAVGTGNIVVNTQGTLQTSANFAAINRRMSQATATSIAQPASTVTAALNPAIRAQRTTPQALTIQEITAIATQAPTQVAQLSTQVARPQLQTTVTAAQLAAAQRITGTSTTGTVQQLAKGFSQQVLSIKQQQTLLAQQKIQQQQQMKMQKLNLTQQQLKQLQQNRGAPKTVITQQVVSSLGQVQKQAQLKTGQIQRQLTPEELIKFKQQQQLAQKAQLSAAQIIPQAQIQHIAQTGTVASGTQLVKTVSAPAGSVPIPVSTVNINVSVPQKTIAKPIVSQLQVQQVPQAKFQHFQQIQRGQLPKQQQKITSISQPVQKTQSIPLNAVQIIQQPSSGSSGRHLTYQLQQIMQQTNKTGSMIISQPTIIATVTQSQQPTSQMVAKVLGTSAAPTSQTIQTIAATPVTVSHVASAATPTPQTSIATLSVAAATGQVSKSVTVTTVTQEPGGAPTTIQVQPVATAVQHHIMQQTTAQVVQPQPQVSQQVTVAQQQKATTLTQASTVTQPFQQIQVTPGTVQQVQTTNVAQPVTTLSSVTVTVTPASQTSSTATLIQQPIVASPTSQNVVQASTVTSQAALAAAAALPQTSTPTLTAVVQSPQQQQIAKPTAPYAMRTRNPPKH